MKNISLFTLVEIALKHIFIIISSALVVSIATFCYCEFVAIPQYSATGSIMVTNGGVITGNSADNVNGYTDSNTLDNTDIQASLNIVTSMETLLNKSIIYKQLSDEFGGKYSYTQLMSATTISKESTNNLFINISCTATTREDAIELVNTYLLLVPDYIKEYGPKSVETSVFPTDSAGMVYPKTLITTAVGGIAGAVIAYAIIFLIYCANTVIKNEDDFRDRFDLPIIGSIPDFATAKSEKYYKKYNYNNKVGKKNDGK